MSEPVSAVRPLDAHSQRELLLDTVLQSTPLARLLANASGPIVYGNIAARQLLRGGCKLEGFDFASLLTDFPAALREAVTGKGDTLFTIANRPGGGAVVRVHLP